jgi:hypothetical protein
MGRRLRWPLACGQINDESEEINENLDRSHLAVSSMFDTLIEVKRLYMVYKQGQERLPCDCS